MKTKLEEKKRAIGLRKRGLSYSEILIQVPVAKSSLSLWLKGVGLAQSQKQRLTERKLAGMKRGWEARRRNRVLLSERIRGEAKKEIGTLSDRELWLIGIALYWGEGNKEKECKPGCGIRFSNSDPRMIKLFLKWLLRIVKLSRSELFFEIYIHENHKDKIDRVTDYWSHYTGFPKNMFTRIYFKRNQIKTKRKNVGNDYYGLLRIGARSSSTLNRKIQGWIEGIDKYCGVV